MKKNIQIIFIFILLINIFYFLNYSVAALTYSDMQSQATEFITKGGSPDIDSNVTTDLVEIGKIMTFIGAGVFVGVVAYMGIKYLTSGPEAQAKLKGQLIGVLVSGLVIFGAYYIWSFVIDVVKDL